MDAKTLDVSGLPEASFDKDHVLLEEGKTNSKVYVLKEGSVAVVSGGNVITKVSEPLTIFGEISLLLDVPASANVVVEEPTTFYVIDDLDALVQDRPEAALHISRILAKRVVAMNKYYLDIKKEVVKFEDNPMAKPSNKLWDVIVKMDKFWGREVL